MRDITHNKSNHQLIGLLAFFFHPVRAWEQGVIISVEDKDIGEIVIVRCKSGETLEIPIDINMLFVPNSPTHIDSLPDDLLELPELHESLLLHTLKGRYSKDLTYMHIGEMILSVNPFKFISSYMENCMSSYLDHLDTAQLPSSLPPHVWSVAHRAYVEMRFRKTNYSIIASGESGSGKTEACKNMLKYLCAASERVTTDEAVIHRIKSISERVQMSNIVLESFGNAKTVKNDNSSRFGKFMEVQFNASGVLVGLRVTPFLLERSRAITCGVDERVYHVFYQLVAGASRPIRELLRIGNFRDFLLLNKGGFTSLKGNGIDDAKDFQILEKALVSIGFSDEEQNCIWSVIGSILHLQNIIFESSRIDDSAYLSDEYIEIANFVASHLLQLPQPKSFVDCLTTSNVTIGGEKLTRKLSVQKANDQRDSICKFLYSKLFIFIVYKTNAATSYINDLENIDISNNIINKEISFIDNTPKTWIALLDIFGFEDFHVNSLEQFCINLANEALQQHYTEKMFMMDMEVMRAEGIEPNITNFKDNQLCLILLQGSKNSIISFLDDASLLDVERSRTNPDFVFLNAITSAFRPDYQTAPSKTTLSVLNRNGKMENPSSYFYRGRLDDNSFTIQHYAGDVKYCVNSFVEKNNDFVKDSCAQTLQGTNSFILKEMMDTKEETLGLLGDAKSPSSPLSPLRGSKRTVASNFRNSLHLLMEMLNSSTCNWVRCIRPHLMRQPGLFDGKLVLEQLVATGVLSTIRQRQNNYPFRPRFDDFLRHYYVILNSKPSFWRNMSLKSKCSTIIQVSNIDKKSIQIGENRVFLTSNVHQKLEFKRLERVKEVSIIIERCALAFFSRAYVRNVILTKHTINIQRIYRTNMRIRLCIHQYYEYLSKKRYERFLDAIKILFRTEMLSRVELFKYHDSFMRSTWREFRTRLIPLVTDVIRNLKLVEVKKREIILSEAFLHYNEFSNLFEHDKLDVLEREKQRISLKLESDARERDNMLGNAIEALHMLTQEEKLAYDELQDKIISPGMKKLKAKSKVLKRLNRWREKCLKELYDARESEERRLAVTEFKELIKEEEKWRSLVGEEKYLEEMRYFHSFSDDPYSTSPPFFALLKEGIPSEIVRSPIFCDRPALSSLGDVSSFRDYRKFMREEFFRSNANTMNSSYHIHSNKEEDTCQTCNFFSYPLRNDFNRSLTKENFSDTKVSRRLYEINSDSDDSFDELNY